MEIILREVITKESMDINRTMKQLAKQQQKIDYWQKEPSNMNILKGVSFGKD